MMSGQQINTASQPALSPSNIVAHPGSTWAGVGVGLMGLGQAFQAGGIPATASGWFQLLVSVGFGVMAALGK